MGLDVRAYKNIKFNENQNEDDNDDNLWISNCNEFKSRCSDHNDGYYLTDECEHFYSSSYGGYSRFRNELSAIAGYPAIGDDHHKNSRFVWENLTTGPFVEQINFTDCDGVIGCELSKKLYQDYVDFQEKADQHTDQLFRDKYNQFRDAFKFASDGGCVVFA